MTMHLLTVDAARADLGIADGSTSSEAADAIVAFAAFTHEQPANAGLRPGVYPFHVEPDGNALVGRSLT